MGHELVHKLTRVGHRHPVDGLPGRALAGRAGALTRTVLAEAALAAALATVLLAVHLAAVAATAALAVHPLAAWVAAIAVSAATPSLVARLLTRVRRDAP